MTSRMLVGSTAVVSAAFAVALIPTSVAHGQPALPNMQVNYDGHQFNWEQWGTIED